MHKININKYTDSQLEEEWNKTIDEALSRNLDKIYINGVLSNERIINFPNYMIGKKIKYCFHIHMKEVIIGFTDNTWIGLNAENDTENGESNLFPSLILYRLPEYIVDFQWDIVSEFEKAGILKNTEVLREILRRKAIKNIDEEIDKYSSRFDYLKEEKKRLESGVLYKEKE